STSSVDPLDPKELIIGLWDFVDMRFIKKGEDEVAVKADVAGAIGCEFNREGYWIEGNDPGSKMAYRFISKDKIEILPPKGSEAANIENVKVIVTAKVSKDDLVLTFDELGIEGRFTRSPLSSPDAKGWSLPRGLVIGVWENLDQKGQPAILDFNKYGRLAV